MSKTFAIGDIHGGYKALLQVIASSGIDKEKDTLIVLGDVVDGWLEVTECVDELLTFKYLIIIRGNHDQWFMNWVNSGVAVDAWVRQGGQATIDSYEQSNDKMLPHMIAYFNNSVPYYIDSKNRAFMHGGYDWHKPLAEMDTSDIMWDRHMFTTALQWEQFHLMRPDKPKSWFKEFEKIFIGHTTTQWTPFRGAKGTTDPVFAVNLINLDTGGGWNGKLTIMNVDTEEFWQSDLVGEIYPEELNARR